MLNKLKSILPEKRNTPHCEPIAELKGHHIGYNEALTEIEALLPDMLALIREEIEKKRITDKKGIIEMVFGNKRKDEIRCHTNMDVGYNKALDDILNILK
jgi:hypothetical protein